MCEPDTERVKKLFVVGNGFDLHHGLSTRFEDFRWYLEEQRAGYDDQVDLVETYLCDLRGNWSNLEEALASLDIDSLRERAQDFLMPYSADDWSDAYNHDYQYEMGEVLEALSRRLVEAIAEWIGGVPIPNPGHLPLLLRVEPDARFISFNYTSTLEKLYGVDPRRVLYIHGSSESGGGPIVLGHGWKQESVGHSDEWDEELRERDPRVQEGEQIIQRYFQDTLKPTAAIIEQNQAFFDSLAGVGEVYVLGHALSPVDLPYFKSIVDATRGAPPRWLVSYHSPSEKESHTEALRSIGVEGDRLDLHPIRKFIRTSCADGVIEGDLSTLWNG